MTAPDFIWLDEAFVAWTETPRGITAKYARIDPVVIAELPEVQALIAAAVEMALATIATLPTPRNEDIIEGHEQAYRAIEVLTPANAKAALDRMLQDAVVEQTIEVEKLLCGKLGIEWSATGISVVSLIDRMLQEARNEALWGASDEDLLRELVRRNPPSKAPRSRTMHDQDCLIGIGKDHHCYITFGNEDLAALQEPSK
jgi:hypothetical protein